MHAMQSLSVIDCLYEASSSGSDWSAIGQELCTRLRAHSGSLRLAPGGHSINVFKPTETQESVYAERYQFIDPIRAAAKRVAVDGNRETAVMTSDDLVPTQLYHRSEFYQDFARQHGQDHMLLGVVGGGTVVGFFRDGSPFGEDARSALLELMPHLQRAVRLHTRLSHLDLDARMGGAAFEALSGAAMVLDSNLNLLFANSTADQLLKNESSPFFVANERSQFGPVVRHLSLQDRTKGARFGALVKDAATGGSGGALRVAAANERDAASHFAVLVAPQPTRFSGSSPEPCPVLVVVKELSRPSPPPAALLGDLFGLSLAEQAVAVALLGGQTAEHVANERSVSLDTVRSQIRTLLRKSDASNLRDFERMGAVLASLSRPTPSFSAAA